MRLYCWLFGHDTNGWEQVPDRFMFRQYAPDPVGAKYGKPHKMVPLWWHFFGHGKHAWTWDRQVCRCTRCGTLFWEDDLVPLKDKAPTP